MWRTSLRQTVRTAAGLRCLTALNTSAYVGDVIDAKRSALAAHATQMARMGDKDGWLTLSDLSQGEFVARLLSQYEVFRRSELAF
jgi:LmbE family N-acetylglucosaminyl deacetylase